MTHSITFFEEPLKHRTHPQKSEKYFASEPVKPVIKKIEKKEQSSQFTRWLKLLPACILIALGATLLPHFGLACAIMVGVLLLNMIIFNLISMFIKWKPKESYLDMLENEQLMITLGAPILEELIFRGAVLQLLLLIIGLMFPPALILPCLNIGVSIAAATAITITAILFCLDHADNAEKNNHAQVVTSFCSGLVLGFFALQFGLLVAIGAHMANNTIVGALINLAPIKEKKREVPIEEQTGLQPQMA